MYAWGFAEGCWVWSSFAGSCVWMQTRHAIKCTVRDAEIVTQKLVELTFWEMRWFAFLPRAGRGDQYHSPACVVKLKLLYSRQVKSLAQREDYTQEEAASPVTSPWWKVSGRGLTLANEWSGTTELDLFKTHWLMHRNYNVYIFCLSPHFKPERNINHRLLSCETIKKSFHLQLIHNCPFTVFRASKCMCVCRERRTQICWTTVTGINSLIIENIKNVIAQEWELTKVNKVTQLSQFHSKITGLLTFTNISLNILVIPSKVVGAKPLSTWTWTGVWCIGYELKLFPSKDKYSNFNSALNTCKTKQYNSTKGPTKMWVINENLSIRRVVVWNICAELYINTLAHATGLWNSQIYDFFFLSFSLLGKSEFLFGKCDRGLEGMPFSPPSCALPISLPCL